MAGRRYDPSLPVTSSNHPPQRAELRPAQRYSCDFVLDNKRVGLFLGLGLGKTLTTLEALYELNPHGHVLVVGPKPVMAATWVDEIAKWGYPFRTKSLMLDDRSRKLSRKARLERYAEVMTDAPTVYFINRDLVADLVDNMPKRNGKTIWPFPIVVLDEAQSFKSPSSNRFKALKRVSPAIDRLIELTGTPAPNGLMDLWALVYLLDGGQRLGDTITKYRTWFFDAHPIPNSRGCTYTIKPGMDRVIHDLVKDVAISFEDVKGYLPPCDYIHDDVHLSKDERDVYKKMEREQVLEFVDGDEAVCANKAVLQTRLSQLASGTLYVNGTHEYKVLHTRKVERLADIVGAAGSPVLVAYRFQSDATEIERVLPDFGWKAVRFDGSHDMIRRWNAREIPVMLVQPASAGAGLNLQEGGHTLVWYTVPWNLEHYLQTNKRIDRPGQTEPVQIHHLLADVGVEHDVMRAIERKERVENALLDAVCVDMPDLAAQVRAARPQQRGSS